MNSNGDVSGLEKDLSVVEKLLSVLMRTIMTTPKEMENEVAGTMVSNIQLDIRSSVVDDLRNPVVLKAPDPIIAYIILKQVRQNLKTAKREY